jgi:eukaryotic-like serine/threonine-protein kinase
MNSQQWEQIEDLFARGIEIDHDRREAFLTENCPDDPAVAAQVRLLWKGAEAAGSFLEQPVAELPVTEEISRELLERGRVLSGRFTVLELLGAGGMGEVYRARDERLGRIVALKVLHHSLVNRPEYRARLEREAMAVSSLGHPRICALYDVGADGDLTYLVMEFLAGEPLSGRLARGPLPLNEFFRISTQVAEALECAHAAGIIHRDLKPANVMLTDAGVKLLDFGVAKRTADGGGALPAEATITAEGQIIGTVAYMSPEQAEGRAVDARSDIFSFGSILYEMATGQRAFQGATSLSTLAAILREEPKPIRKLVPASPASLDVVIRNCLHKKPDERPSGVREIRTQLESLRDTLASKNSRVRAAMYASAAICAAALASLAWTAFPRASSSTPKLNAPVRVTVEGGNARYPALSPDGKLLVYGSDRAGNFDLYVKQVGGDSEVRLTNTPHNEAAPSFTPDGKYIVFQSDEDNAGLQVIPALGGERRILATIRAFRPRVSPDGSQVLFWAGPYGEDMIGPRCNIWIVPMAGGTPRKIQEEFLRAGFPIWLEDSRHIVFVGDREFSAGAGSPWWITTADGETARRIPTDPALQKLGEPRRTFIPGFAHKGSVFGYTQLNDSSVVVKVSFNPQNPEAKCTASRVLDHLELIQDTAASGTGTMAFTSTTSNSDVYRLRFDKATGQGTQLDRLTNEPSGDTTGSLSEDGRLLAFLSNRGGPRAVWVKDLESNTTRRIALVPPTTISQARISPDGKFVAYTPDPEKQPNKEGALMVAPTAGGSPIVLARGRWFPNEWTAPDVLRSLRVDEAKLERRQYVDFSMTSRKQLWESSWIGSEDECWPQGNLEWCSLARADVLTARSLKSSKQRAHEIIKDSPAVRFIMISPDGSTVYWTATEGNSDSVWGRKVNPETGAPQGKPFLAYRFRGPARLANVNYQAPTLRNNTTAITLVEKTSNIWLQALPE